VRGRYKLQDTQKAELHIGFVMSTEVGLHTQYLNWRACLTPELGVKPEWIVIDWWKRRGRIERIPLLPDSFKARLRGEVQLRNGLKKGPYDALFVAQERIFHGTNSFLFRQDYFVTADVTAIQLAAFGDLYRKLPSGPAFYERQKHAERVERLKRAKALFPWSRWAAQSMVEDYGADPDTIHVISPGVIMEKLLSNPDLRRQGGPARILFVGGDFYRKGGDLLLKWANQTSRTDWHLDIVTRDLVVPTHKNVKIHRRLGPNSPELLALYSEANIFALPTRGDCYSIASVEAMAAGLPVILSRTGGTGDIISEGRTGFLIEPGDSDALFDRLDYLLANPERQSEMGAAAREEAEVRFDANKNVAQTIDIMRSYLK
jgi:glycosyltransferase involved in cell wall biosynthesis